MIKQLFTGLLGLSVLTSNSQVIPNKDWVKYKSDRSQISNVPSAIDANNNAFITGYMFVTPSNANANTVKYDPLGNELWTASYDNGCFDNSKAIVIDAAGNSYVTGESDGTGTNRDIITIKYDPNGAQLWAMRFNGATNGNDVGNSIVLDPSGNVYVTGYTTNMAGNRDYVTIKYNASGVQQFAVIYAGVGNGNDEAVGVAFNNNRLYVTGTAINASGNSDIVTLRLNQNTGATMWSKSENGTANGNDVAYALLAYNNDVVVVGQIANSATGNDYITSYYNGNNGNTSWSKQYDFAGSNGGATALTVDASNRFAVTGIVNNSGVLEYHTLLYNTSGTQLWVNKVSTGLTGLNANPQIAVDPIANHFYVCGQKQGTGSDILVYQITPSGNKTWEETFNGAQNSTDAAVDLVVNSLGVIYVAGASLNSSAKFDYTTIRISQTPVYFPTDLGAQELNDNNYLFQSNDGQLNYPNATQVPNNEVEYFFQGKSPVSYINKARLTSLLISSSSNDLAPDTTYRVDLEIFKSNPNTRTFSFNEFSGKYNYLIGGTNGITDVRSFQRLMIPNIYPDIDLHYYSNSAGLKPIFVIKNTTALANIHLRISGALSTTINASGELIAKTLLGDVNYGKPRAHQTNMLLMNVPITGTVTWQNIGGNDYNFNITGYNPSLPIVISLGKIGSTSSSAPALIDNLYWSTFVGSVGNDDIINSKVDAKDNVYLIGSTTSINFPTLVGPFININTNPSGITYGILSVFDKDGKPIYGTYYGGSTFKSGCSNIPFTKINDVAIDSTYNIYIVGTTNTSNMITQTISVPNAINQSTNASTAASSSSVCQNAFIAKLNPAGNQLRFSTYFGGTNSEGLNFVKTQNNHLVTGGSSFSNSITLTPTNINKYQINTGSGMFLHLDTLGSLLHNTKLVDVVNDGDMDKLNNSYVVGSSLSNALPLVSPAPGFYVQPKLASFDWTIQRISSTDSLTWSTYLGGSSNDYLNSIFIRDSIMALAGYGTSSNFPFTAFAGDSGNAFVGGSDDIQMVKLNTKTGALIWSAYHATTNKEQAKDVVIDKLFNLFLTGSVEVVSGCATNCFRRLQPLGYYLQNNQIGIDAFVMGFSASNKRKWTTTFGTTQACASCSGSGYNDEWGKSLVINSKNQLFMSGFTRNKNNKFPLSKWNNLCYYDSTIADPFPSNNPDMYITMFDVSSFNAVGIKEINDKIVSNDNNVVLYPNPNGGDFNLKFKAVPTHKSEIEITNLIGQVIMQQKQVELTNDYPIKINNLPSGVYFLTLSNANQSSTIKFIVK